MTAPGPDRAPSAAQDQPSEALAALVRDEGSRVLARLVRFTGDLALAQDAVADAVVAALQSWAGDGVPAEPRAWLTLTARRRAIDLIRRESARRDKEAQAAQLAALTRTEVEPVTLLDDDRLPLFFTCCHPSLAAQTQIVLCLRTLGGFSNAEVARALLVTEAAVAKRVTRARQKIARAGIPYRVPPAAELPDRLDAVARVIYLIFSEGYAAGAGDDVLRPELLDEAVRLARLLARLMPDDPTALGLLALLLLQDSRRRTRTGPHGDPLRLSEQDRSQWDRAMIAEGVDLLAGALRRSPDRPDPHVVQAAIAACHAIAPSWERTDWDAVVFWYDVLLGVLDTPVTRLNRAAAIAERDGPQAGLALLDTLEGLETFPWWHAGRALLLARTGQPEPAALARRRAADAGLPPAYLARLDADLGAG